MRILKKSWSILSIMMLLSCGMFMEACGDDNDDSGDKFDMSQLVGSQWKRTYSYLNTDDGSKEDGECLLTFTTSGQAEEYISYHGAEWKWSYENGDEYKSYSGTNTEFYTYQVTGTNITLMGDEEYDEPINIVVSGNKMTASNGLEWTLAQKGSSSVEEPTLSYTWTNMQGVWMESNTYGAYAETIETYKRQNASSNIYLNNSYDGDFSVSGYQFNTSGAIKDLFVCTKIWHNDNALILKTINTSDNKTVYWTDIENNSFSDKLTIRGNEIYHKGNVRFEIISPKMILEKSSDTIYEKVK